MVWTGLDRVRSADTLCSPYGGHDQLYLVARFLVSEGFCFIAEVSATTGELEACKHTLEDVPGILPCLFVLAGQKLGVKRLVQSISWHVPVTFLVFAVAGSVGDMVLSWCSGRFGLAESLSNPF